MIVDHKESNLHEIMTSTEAVCSRMMNLIEVFSRKSNQVTSQISQIVTEACSQASDSTKELKINLTINKNTLEVRVPESRLLPMVFDNLLRNVAVHAGENSTVDVEVYREGDTVIIIITDDGPGIAKEIREKLFQKGVSTRGGGLGLYLSREVIKANEGTIELVESPPDKGATFKVVLPIIR
jgi:signal transduction histidine kinase